MNIRVNGYSVDLVPGHRQNAETADHSLYVSKHSTWIKSNVQKHIAYVRAARRQDETRILKLWRNRQGLDFPSFYLELAVIRVLGAHSTPYLSANIHAVFEYLRDAFFGKRNFSILPTATTCFPMRSARRKSGPLRSCSCGNWWRAVGADCDLKPTCG